MPSYSLSRPEDAAWGADGLWPITCTTSRLVPRPASRSSRMRWRACFVKADDARVKPYQKLLAMVLTMRFDHGWQATDILSMVGMYALQHLALERRLTSLTVVHMPGEELSARRPHAHCVVLARVHRASGWGEAASAILSPRMRRSPFRPSGKRSAMNGRRASRPAEQAHRHLRQASRVPPAGAGRCPPKGTTYGVSPMLGTKSEKPDDQHRRRPRSPRRCLHDALGQPHAPAVRGAARRSPSRSARAAAAWTDGLRCAGSPRPPHL
ncbi:hypothetical protein AB5I41_16480 [Sphingomonas sp. MMS24-JH45]